MIRILIALTLAAAALVIFAAFAGLDGFVEGAAFGLRFEAPAAVVAATVLLLIALVAGATSLAKDITRLPGAWRGRKGASLRARGDDALARGLNALARGDAAAALREGHHAEKALGQTWQTRLLVARAAALSGDAAAEQAALTALRDDPQTHIIGLRGLYEAAVRNGDASARSAAAKAALAAAPDAPWAFNAAIESALEAADWSAARGLVERARTSRIIDVDRAQRAQAVILAVDAHAAEARGDSENARIAAAAAAKADPTLAPAALIAARLLGEDEGRTRKRLGVALAETSDERLGRALAERGSAPMEAASYLDRLAQNSSSPQAAAIARARAALLRDDPHTALAALGAALSDAPSDDAIEIAARAAHRLGRHAAAEALYARLVAPPDFRAYDAAAWARLVFGALRGENVRESDRVSAGLPPDLLRLLMHDEPTIASPSVEPDAPEYSIDRASELDRAQIAAREIS